MIYRELGRTGLKVSQLGFGAMRLPIVGDGDHAVVDRDQAIPMIHRAFEGGINYIDTAVFYCNHDSQRAVGEALKGWRDRIVVSTKNHDYGEDEVKWWKNLEDSLDRLGVSQIDLYHHHGMNWKKWTDAAEPRVRKWMQKARDQGLVKHIGFSFHDNNEALRKLIDTGYPQFITLQYNLLDRQLEEGIARAHAAGIGVIVMGPVGGGRLGAQSGVLEQMLPQVRRVPELAMRFVLSNPHVSVALSGMSTMQHVEENLATAADPVALNDADKAAIDEHLERLRRMADLYCTGCNYCQPCPHEVKIPQIFAHYNLGRVYGLWEVAKQRYANLLKKQGFDACIGCGECEDNCPQHLAIREQLEEAHKALTNGKQ